LELYITIGIIAVGIFLFIKDYFTIDTTSILIMALFIVAGVLSPEEGFAGFNHPATLTLGCMFVVSAGVFKSGIIDGLSSKIVRVAKSSYAVALIIFCVISALFSAFVNDSAVVALLIPIVLSVCRETGIAPSKLLIPISFSALFGGTCTLIGTSTNILVSSIAEKSGGQAFGMFEFTLPALCLLAIGLLYMFFIAPFLLPDRKPEITQEARNTYNYITELVLLEKSYDENKKIKNSSIANEYHAQIVSIIRNNETISIFDQETQLLKDDILKVIVSTEKLAELRKKNDYRISGNKLPMKESTGARMIFETLVPVGSDLAGNSLKTLKFRNVYNASVLAIRNRDKTADANLGDIEIQAGDLLVIYATRDELSELLNQNLLISLSEHKETSINYKKAIPAILIAIGVVTCAALNITSILISGMVGALLLVTTSILKPKEAYEAIEWKVIFMMAGVLSMGAALEKTGGAEIISQFVFETMGDFDPRITLSLIFLVTFLSTNVLSSKATAALMAPIVISLAVAMQVNVQPFLIAVMFACSLTFMTPVSYPTNTMVYAPGNYKFNDFLKVGTPLNIIIWIAASFIIPLFFPF